MKHFVLKSVLAFGAASLVLVAQTPQTSQPPSSTAQSTSDTQMAAKVRSALTTDTTTGTAAHNVKVTAHNGMVTLHGKVASESDKDAILSKAKSIAGDSNVKDEITVSKK